MRVSGIENPNFEDRELIVPTRFNTSPYNNTANEGYPDYFNSQMCVILDTELKEELLYNKSIRAIAFTQFPPLGIDPEEREDLTEDEIFDREFPKRRSFDLASPLECTLKTLSLEAPQISLVYPTRKDTGIEHKSITLEYNPENALVHPSYPSVTHKLTPLESCNEDMFRVKNPYVEDSRYRYLMLGRILNNEDHHKDLDLDLTFAMISRFLDHLVENADKMPHRDNESIPRFHFKGLEKSVNLNREKIQIS